MTRQQPIRNHTITIDISFCTEMPVCSDDVTQAVLKYAPSLVEHSLMMEMVPAGSIDFGTCAVFADMIGSGKELASTKSLSGCEKCEGTGKIARGGSEYSGTLCPDCDGTGLEPTE